MYCSYYNTYFIAIICLCGLKLAPYYVSTVAGHIMGDYVVILVIYAMTISRDTWYDSIIVLKSYRVEIG